MRKPIKYSADFETTTDVTDCRTWLWAICEVENPDNYTTGKTIEEFFDYVYHLSNAIIYFHNLKFDIQFMLSYLLNDNYVFNSDKEHLSCNEFNSLITEEGVFYQLTIRNLHGVTITFNDSYKKLPFSVHDLALAFNIEEKKGSIDYTKDHPIGYEPDDNEKDYMRNDVVIVAKALKKQFEQGMNKLTVSSDALSIFKKMTPNFNTLFPILPEQDEFFRKAYRGGFTYVNPVYENKIVENIDVYDVNSLYPSVLYFNSTPIGTPIYFTDKYEPDSEYPLYITHFFATFKLKEHAIPMIQDKHNCRFAPNEYITESIKEPLELYLTSVDYELFKDMYDIITINFIDGYKFQEKYEVFVPYIDKFNKMKMDNTPSPDRPNADPSLRALAKLAMNSLYGKFASRTKGSLKEPYLDDDGIVKYRNLPEEIKDPIYTPVACFTTANARNKTIRSAYQLMQGTHLDNNGKEYYNEKDYFIYCDTDSLHIFVHPDIDNIIEVHSKDLGKWKHENKEPITRAKFIRAKTYVEEHELDTEIPHEDNDLRYYKKDNKYYMLDVKCAGMSEVVKQEVTIENFKVGFTSYKKLKPQRVKGGVVLVPTPFTIK